MSKILDAVGIAAVLALAAPVTTRAADAPAEAPAVKPAVQPAVKGAAKQAAAPAAKAAMKGAAKGKSAAAKAEAGAPTVKVGDTVHVCGCGASCPCGTIQAGPGKCGCGAPLVKATVARIEGDKIIVTQEGKPEQAFKAPYRCGCKDCQCGAVGVAPGKCGCGHPLVKN